MSTPQREGSDPTTAVAVVEQGQAVDLSTAWTREQIQLVKDTIARNAELTDDEFRLFVATCQRMNLDPLARQIHAVKRKGKLVIQVGIDGFRVTADRTKVYAGNSDPTYDVKEVEVSTKDGPALLEIPWTASVTVRKIVMDEPRDFTATARWLEYYPGEGSEGFFWRKMPYLMLGKCAEALALRKAFPAELSGVYLPEEMDQAGPGDKPRQQAQQSKRVDSPKAEAARALGPPFSIELPWGKDKGTPLGALSNDHLSRLLKWARAGDRDADFGEKWKDLIQAFEDVLEERRLEEEAKDSDLERRAEAADAEGAGPTPGFDGPVGVDPETGEIVNGEFPLGTDGAVEEDDHGGRI